MALYLYYIEEDRERAKELHLGASYSCYNRGINVWKQVTEIQADGDELNWVRENFKNLPCSTFKVCNWYGDHAKLIAAGLFYL